MKFASKVLCIIHVNQDSAWPLIDMQFEYNLEYRKPQDCKKMRLFWYKVFAGQQTFECECCEFRKFAASSLKSLQVNEKQKRLTKRRLYWILFSNQFATKMHSSMLLPVCTNSYLYVRIYCLLWLFSSPQTRIPLQVPESLALTKQWKWKKPWSRCDSPFS